MTQPQDMSHERFPDTHHDTYSKDIFGFWLYLMSDFILFATLFATYSVLQSKTFGGPSASEIFHLPFTLIQTLILLCTSFTSGLAGAWAHRKNKQWTILFFVVTFFLGIAFMGMEFNEFSRLIGSDSSWRRSGFLSAYFTVVGTHGVHMIFALLWILVLLPPVFRYGITPVSLRRLTSLRMFWQFLNVIWVFIFTIIYLMGGKNL